MGKAKEGWVAEGAEGVGCWSSRWLVSVHSGSYLLQFKYSCQCYKYDTYNINRDCSSYLQQFFPASSASTSEINPAFVLAHPYFVAIFESENIFRNKCATWLVQVSGILCSMINSVNRVAARTTFKSLLLVKKCWMLRGGLLSTLAACFVVFIHLSTSPIRPCPTLKSQYANETATPDLRITAYFNSYSCRYFRNTSSLFIFGPSGWESSFSVSRSDI